MRLALIAAVLVAVQAAVVFGVRAGEARPSFHPAEIAPSIEFFGERTLTQTFVAHADGLTAITLYPIRRRTPTAGTVELTLASGRSTVAHATVAAADVLARPEWTWTFPPVVASARQPFELRVAVPQATAGSGLSLAIGPPTYDEGALSIGGRAQWGDLLFETRSQYSRVVDLLRRRPAVQRGAWVPPAAGAAMVLLAIGLAALTLGLLRDRAVDG